MDLTVEPLEIVRHGAIKDEEIMSAIEVQEDTVCTGRILLFSNLQKHYLKILAKQDRRMEVASAGMLALKEWGQ